MSKKLYAGAKLREIRQRLNISQLMFAQRLDVSTPYLSQMENNHRFDGYDILTLPQFPIK